MSKYLEVVKKLRSNWTLVDSRLFEQLFIRHNGAGSWGKSELLHHSTLKALKRRKLIKPKRKWFDSQVYQLTAKSVKQIQ